MVASRGIRSGNRSRFKEQAKVQGDMVDIASEEDKASDENSTVPTKSELSVPDNLTHVTPIPHITVSMASCVKALERAISFSRSALYLEVAVALVVYAGSTTGADLPTKRKVTELYKDAGYRANSGGEDYKTVNRRVNASAKLFNKIGLQAILLSIGGLREGKAIEALTLHLGETYKFTGINDVLEYVGEPVVQSNAQKALNVQRDMLEGSGNNAGYTGVNADNQAEAVGVNERIEARRAERLKILEEEADGIIVSAGKLSMVLPRDCKADEVMLMVAKLTEFAARLAEEEGTPEEQHNREMHS